METSQAEVITDVNVYVAKVTARLPTPAVITEREKAANDGFIRLCWRRGWTLDDMVAYCLCMEEFSPELDEGTACERMAAIEKKYPF